MPSDDDIDTEKASTTVSSAVMNVLFLSNASLWAGKLGQFMIFFFRSSSSSSISVLIWALMLIEERCLQSGVESEWKEMKMILHQLCVYSTFHVWWRWWNSRRARAVCCVATSGYVFSFPLQWIAKISFTRRCQTFLSPCATLFVYFSSSLWCEFSSLSIFIRENKISSIISLNDVRKLQQLWEKLLDRWS